MGILISKLWNRLFASNDYHKILMLGLGNAGKTTILYQLHLGEVVVSCPTVGSNVETIQNKNIRFQVWDVGGQDTIRSMWQEFFENTKAVIFVVDSQDRKNEVLNKMELLNLLNNENLKNSIFLILANKQDLSDAMDPAEISDKLLLHEIKNHEWKIQPCSAIKGKGLNEGIDWISDKLLEQNKNK